MKFSGLISNFQFFFDVLSVGSAKIIALVAFFVTNIIIARYLGPEGKGLVSIFTVVPHLVVSLSIFGMDKSANYVLGKRQYLDGQVLSALIVSAIFALIIGVAVPLLYFYSTWSPNYTTTLVALTISVALFEIVQRLSTGIMLGREMIFAYSFTRWVPSAVQMLYVVAIVAIATLGAQDVVFGVVLGTFLSMVYSLMNVFRRIPFAPKFDSGCYRFMLGYGAASMVGEFLVMFNYKVQIFTLQFLGTIEQVGLYALGQNFSELLWQIPGAISAVVLSRSANATSADAFAEKIGVLLRITLYGCAVVAVGLGVFLQIAIPLVFGEAFSESATVVWILLPGVVGMIAFQILVTDLAGRGRPMIGTLIIAPMVAINIGLGALLAPTYGVAGAAAAASLSYLATTVVTIIVYCRVSRLNPGAFILLRRSDIDFLLKRLPLGRIFGRGA